MSEEKMYLWLNISDLSDLGGIGSFGSPLNFMIRPALGDELLTGHAMHRCHLDENYLLVHATPDRIAAINDAMQMISERKRNGQKIRHRITPYRPQHKTWRWVERA